MLEGYAWPLSVAPGETVALHVSTDAGPVSMTVVLDGASSSQPLHSVGDLAAGAHPIPDDASERGCDWPAAHTFTVPPDARSGYYAITLRAGQESADAFVVVRPTVERAAPLLLLLATPTYNAYNDFGGPSLYTGGHRVSFERPLARGFLRKPEPIGRMMQTEPDPEAMGYRSWARPLGLSDWSGASGWWNWERPFLHWAEREGLSVDVALGHDLQLHPEIVEGHRAIVSVGHDEYWSREMRDTFDSFTAGGGHAAIFSGNTCFWQVRIDDEGRSMTCFKYDADDDPVTGTSEEHRLSGAWSDRRIGHPETSTIGLTFTRGGYSRYGSGAPRSSGGFTVHRPEHWVFEGTDLQGGDSFGTADAIVAYEVDGCALTMSGGLPVPTHEDGAPTSLEILATAPARLWPAGEQPSRYAGELGELEACASALFGDASPEHTAKLANNHAVFATFTTRGGGTVVNTGVTDWAFGLKHGDPHVTRITRNILARVGASPS